MRAISVPPYDHRRHDYRRHHGPAGSGYPPYCAWSCRTRWLRADYSSPSWWKCSPDEIATNKNSLTNGLEKTRRAAPLTRFVMRAKTTQPRITAWGAPVHDRLTWTNSLDRSSTVSLIRCGTSHSHRSRLARPASSPHQS